jgi:hypothetical protein
MAQGIHTSMKCSKQIMDYNKVSIYGISYPHSEIFEIFDHEGDAPE